MNYKNEKIIIKIIKFAPPLFIISVSLFLILFLYTEYKNTYTQEKYIIEKEFIELNKKIIKQNVDTVYNTIKEIQKTTETQLKNSIKKRVYEAHTIATKIYNENKHKDKKIIKKMIQDALVNIRFNKGRGYFYIYSLDYECILFPLNRSIEGKSFYNFQDIKGKYLTRDIISQVKAQNEGFMSWHFYKPNDKNTHYKKIGFNKYFEPLDWFIGTGEYIDEFEEDVKQQALNYIQTLKYVDNNYIFVLNYDGIYLHHIKKHIIGKSGLLANGENSANDVKNSTKVVSNAINIAKTNGFGYVTYTQNKKFNVNKPIKKTSYIKAIKNWGWVIGQGFYYDAIYLSLEKKKKILEDKFNLYIQDIIIFGLLLMIILLFISIYISKIIQNKFTKYKKEIDSYILENNKQRAILSHQTKMSALGEMLGNIAHQWRQPLSIISTISTSYKVKKELELNINPNELLEDMDKINHNVQYLSRTIDDFRSFIKGDLELESFNLKDNTKQFLKLVESTIKKHELTIILEEIDDNIIIKNYPNQLTQCFINILNNARDALIKNDNEKYIFISEVIQDNKVIIKIKDNAGGIPDKTLPRIFEPYFTTKHQTHGTGIGLHMTYNLITEAMGGSIKANNIEFIYKNKTYKGAEFTIELPLDIV